MGFVSKIVAVLVFLGAFTAARAQVPERYRFSLLDINQGLSSNQVQCFLKDSRGYLWVGTIAGGLNRYDGYQHKVFKYQSHDTTSLLSNDVTKLLEGPDRKIWVQTSQGVCVFDPVTERFYRNPGALLKQYKLPNGRVEDLLKDKAGNFWFVISGQGLARYNPNTNRAVQLKHAFSDKNSLSTNNISALGQDSRGGIWIIHKSGILEKLDPATLKVTERNDEIYRKYSREALDYALMVDSANDLWLYVREKEGGVYFYQNGSKTLQHFHKGSSPIRLNNNLVRGMVEGEPGQIWIGTDHGGINLLNKHKATVQYIRHDPEVDRSLAHNSIYALYKDPEGIIWVGTFKKGINYYHKNSVRFSHDKHRASVAGSLPFDDVNAFAEDAKGNLWIGTNGGGLLYLDRKTGLYTKYTHNPANANSIASDVVVSLLLDRQQNLWIGTYLGGLDKFDGKTFTHYKNEPGNPESLADNSIWELYQDAGGNIWAGTLRGGLELLNPQQTGFIHSSVGKGRFPIHCNYITSLAEDRLGNLWVGGGYGLDVFHKETGKSTYFFHDPKNPQSLISNSITFLHRDRRNNLWIGTTEGLDLYNEKENTFTHFTTRNGLPNNTITTILEDQRGNLWISTRNGISHLIIRQEQGGGYRFDFRNYDELDGLQGKAFNENAALRTRQGELIFGGANGFNLFRPGAIEKNSRAPRVVFTDFQLFNQSLEANKPFQERIILTKSISETEHLTLEHDENVFSIGFAALNFIHPEKNRYRYKLEGFDKEWRTADASNRKVTYTNLDPGEYTFQVLASNNDGVWTQTGASLKITVLAPFWQTPLAFVLYAVAAIVALVVVRRVELRKTAAKFRLEQERREARQLHDLDLMKIKFFTNVSHEFRTPLTLILAPLEKLLKTQPDPELQQQLQMINKNARRLLNMVNQLLDFKKMDVNDVRLTPAEGNVVAFVQDTVNSFVDLSDKKNIPLSFTASVQELVISFDKDKLEKILFNLLSNAFKFTPEQGRIAVELNCHPNDSSSEGIKILEIKVKDTGIGIAREHHQKIFERFFRDQVPSHLINQGSGIGLALVQEFVNLHGGMITVDSAPGAGSCFTVTLPVKELSPQPAPAEREAELEEQTSEEPVAAPKAAAAAFAQGKPVVLITEDNEDFRFYLKDSLSPHFNILEARDGKEGWQKALAHLPDLIVSDLMMPEVDGMEFCKKIKADARTSQIPFVLLTAHASDEKKLKGLNVGANDYLTKPFNFDLLLTRIRNLIAQRELLQKVFEKKISVQASENEIVSLDDKLIRKAIQLVEDNLSNPDLSVEEMSRELGVSRVHLYKKMVAITGQSPVEFIRKIRLQHAAQYLEKSQLTVAEVAYKVGFNNRKYFTKYFKEEYNILPSQYAERLREKEAPV